MSELIASYVTNIYALRLVKPFAFSEQCILFTDTPDSKRTTRADLAWFEAQREMLQASEELLWQDRYQRASQENKPKVYEGWKQFREYAGLPPLTEGASDGTE